MAFFLSLLRSSPVRWAASLTLLYVAIAAAWLIAGGRIMAGLPTQTAWQVIIVDAGLVVITGLFLFWLILRGIRVRRSALRRTSDRMRQYRRLFESNPNPMWVFDDETLRFLAVNGAAIRQYGYSRQEFLSMTIRDIRPSEDVPALLIDMDRGDEVLSPMIWRHLRKDGRIIYVETASELIRYGRRRARLVTVNDVTDQVRVSHRLEARTRQQEVVIDLGLLALRSGTQEDLSPAAVQAARSTLKADGCVLIRRDAGEGRSEVVDYDGAVPVGEAVTTLACSLAATSTLQSGETTQVSDLAKAPEFEGDVLMQQVGARSVACVTIGRGDAPWGVLMAYGTEPREFTLDEIHFLQAVANIIAQFHLGREASRQLSETEGRYRRLILNAVEAICVADAESGVVIEANPAFWDWLGYSPDDLGSITIFDISAHNAESTRRNLARVSYEEPLTLDRQWRRRDGTVFEVQITITRHRQAGRDIVFVIARDVSHQRMSETRLKQSERKYRELFERANVPILIFKPENEIILEANAEACEMYGYSRDEIIGMSLETLTADVHRGRAEVAYIIENGGTRNFETVHLTKAGVRLNLLASCSLLEYAGEEAILCFGRNITDRIRAEHLLQDSESRFRAVTENATDVIAIVDVGTKVLFASGGTAEVLGYDHQSFIGLYARRFIHQEDWRRAYLDVKRALALPRGVFETELRFRHRDGSWRHLSVRGRNLLDQSGVSGILVNIRDVTERKQFEQQLMHARDQAEELARLKSAFLANMSHEIRTPLTGIIGFAEVLTEEIDGEHKEFLELIRDGGHRLLDTLNSVLDLARIEAGGFTLDLQRVDVHAAIRSHIELLVPTAEKKGIALSYIPPSGRVVCLADAPAIGRILSNLVSNAIKFTESGGVTVRLQADGEEATIVVEDTGIGMDAEFLPFIFDEFRQESTGLSRSHQGTGLGLTITRKLVEMIGGTIDVESRKGEGTIFTIRLPKMREPSVATSAVAKSTLPANGSGNAARKILVVEDNVTTRQLLDRMLQGAFDATIVADAETALSVARKQSFDVVLLDINLGQGMDGIDLMHALRQIPDFSACPMVAVTAYALPEDAARFCDEGFDHYLAKPFTRAEILSGIDGLIERTPG
jgi:PAS domain S-box-containing protein